MDYHIYSKQDNYYLCNRSNILFHSKHLHLENIVGKNFFTMKTCEVIRKKIIGCEVWRNAVHLSQLNAWTIERSTWPVFIFQTHLLSPFFIWVSQFFVLRFVCSQFDFKCTAGPLLLGTCEISLLPDKDLTVNLTATVNRLFY